MYTLINLTYFFYNEHEIIKQKVWQRNISQEIENEYICEGKNKDINYAETYSYL